MANYTAADIKALRESTGAGMLDVKKALDEADGDIAKATEIIRVKGLKGIAKREGRAASDGLVAANVADGAEGQVGVLIELNSETDFVAKNDKFIALGDKVLAAAVAAGTDDVAAVLAADADGQSVQAAIDELAAVIGEKLVLRRVARVAAPRVTVYLHKVNKDLPPQVGVLVGSDEAGAAVAKDVAMHIAAYSPTYLTRDEVPAETAADERRIAEETARNEGKPEAALAKIVEGRMTGFYKENVLVDQAFAKDQKKSVAQVLAEVGGTVTSFARFRVGACAGGRRPATLGGGGRRPTRRPAGPARQRHRPSRRRVEEQWSRSPLRSPLGWATPPTPPSAGCCSSSRVRPSAEDRSVWRPTSCGGSPRRSPKPCARVSRSPSSSVGATSSGAPSSPSAAWTVPEPTTWACSAR